jgi:hypothetical protein
MEACGQIYGADEWDEANRKRPRSKSRQRVITLDNTKNVQDERWLLATYVRISGALTCLFKDIFLHHNSMPCPLNFEL